MDQILICTGSVCPNQKNNKMNKQLKIHDVIQETQDAISVIFQRDKHINTYESGQFINVFQMLDDAIISRSYSFSSSPVVDHLPSITIKKVHGGRLSNYLVNNLKKGQEITVSQPMGRFNLGNIPDKVGYIIFIAGGSGITPLISMIKTVLNSTKRPEIILLYGNKNEDSIIFRDTLNQLQTRSNGRFNVLHFLDEIINPINFEAEKGHISIEHIRKILLTSKPIKGVYICGPAGMMQSVNSHLENLAVDPVLIHMESFSSGLKKPTEKTMKPSRVNFIQKEGSVQLDIPRGQYILETALKEGLSLPHSCKEAMCGTCKVRILSGRVNMTENYALTDSQIKEGYALLCSAIPSTDEITLSYH